MQMEVNTVLQALKSCSSNPVDVNEIVKWLAATITKDMNCEQKQTVENMLKRFCL